MHIRDAARDGEDPPTHVANLKSLTNMVSVEAMQADDDADGDSDDVADTPSSQKKSAPTQVVRQVHQKTLS